MTEQAKRLRRWIIEVAQEHGIEQPLIRVRTQTTRRSDNGLRYTEYGDAIATFYVPTEHAESFVRSLSGKSTHIWVKVLYAHDNRTVIGASH